MLLLLVCVATLAQGAPARKLLSGQEVRQLLVGNVITDNVHWRYYLKPNGSIDANEMGRTRKGRWHIQDNQLCIAIAAGAAPDACWDVVRQGKVLLFRENGTDVYEVKVEKPGS
ncbi:hypothetical protein C3Z06_31920 (plasmid) [Cupriavidus metallidurans]|nr:hypothetical protein C3Z06_31920 [Cupriavidus metallidurans]